MTDRPTPNGTITATITVADPRALMALLGRADENLRYIEGRSPSVDVHVRGDTITITGVNGQVHATEGLLKELLALIENGENVDPDIIRRTETMLQSTSSERPVDVLTHNIVSRRGKSIRPKTVGQKRYVQSIDGHTIVFGIGPAGTGKTYLAMAKAVQALQAKEVTRIILTRPAVEAGEKLGFLPGTLGEKIDPYLRPLYDALHDMLDPGSIPKLMESGTIEVAPLAYMRGRAHPTGTDVLTPDGWRRIGELEVGDLVVGSDGRPTPVLGVYPQGVKDIYRVTTQDGASVLCSDEHLWAVATWDDEGREQSHQVLETKQMAEGLRRHRRRYQLPLVSDPVEFPEREVPMDPYTLGLLLGEGRRTRSTARGLGAANAEASAALGEAPGGVATADSMTEVMRRLELDAGTTFIPDDYRYNGAQHRLALLQGLLDAGAEPVRQRDGTCVSRFTTASTRLGQDVVDLVRSLGGTADGRGGANVLDIRLAEGMEPFRLARKGEQYRRAGGGRPMRFIDSIDVAGEAEAVCIQVAAEDSLYVTEDYLVTHNTLNDAFIILDEAQNTTPEQMKMFLTRLGFGSQIVVTGDVTQVDLPGATRSGLRVVREILEGVDDVYFASLSAQDVVRHQLVSDIVNAYERWDADREAKDQRRSSGH